MSRAFGLAMMLVALYIAMTLYTKGFEQATADLFSPIQSRERDGSFATHLTPAAGEAAEPGAAAPRVRVTDAVRQRVTADIQAGARRREVED